MPFARDCGVSFLVADDETLRHGLQASTSCSAGGADFHGLAIIFLASRCKSLAAANAQSSGQSLGSSKY